MFYCCVGYIALYAPRSAFASQQDGGIATSVPGDAAGLLEALGDSRAVWPRESKRVLEYGVQAPVCSMEIYREANVRQRFSTDNRNVGLFLQTSLNISGNLREFTRECHLGVMYSRNLTSRGWDLSAQLCVDSRSRQSPRELLVAASHLTTSY